MAEKKERTFSEKVISLKNLLKNSPEHEQQLKHYEDRMAELQIQKEWLSHPNTKALADICRDAIRTINVVLSTKEDLSDVERKSLFREKSAHQAYLALLTDDPEGEIESVEKSVNELDNEVHSV